MENDNKFIPFPSVECNYSGVILNAVILDLDKSGKCHSNASLISDLLSIFRRLCSAKKNKNSAKGKMEKPSKMIHQNWSNVHTQNPVFRHKMNIFLSIPFSEKRLIYFPMKH